MPNKLKVCQWGTSDTTNYGDQLFPLIAKEQLTTRLPGLELTCYAPVGRATLPPGSPPLFPLVPGGGPLNPQRREHFARLFDAILVGGGDLMRFDRSEPGYDSLGQERPVRPYDAFLDFLWEETEPRPNILWNVPGVPFPFEPSRRLLVQRACSYVRHVAVRDEVSRGYLLEAGVEGPIHVFPDTGILLAELISRRVAVEKVRDLLKDRGAKLDGRGLLCFQCSPGFLRGEEELVAESLARIADKRNLEIVLLPIGLCHGDRDALRLVQRASGNRFTLADGIVSPLKIGAVIGTCDYFVGSSLHGNLTALSFGIPHIVVNNPLRSAKLEGLVQLAQMTDFRITDWEALEDVFDRLAATPRERWVTVGDRLKDRASEHFDRLADLILQAATEHRKPNGTRNSAKPSESGAQPDGHVLLDVYSTIAELHQRLDDERAAARLAIEKERSAMNARLDHLKTQNESLRNRLHNIENSMTWRLFGPYRRLRAKTNALTKPASEGTQESDDTRPG